MASARSTRIGLAAWLLLIPAMIFAQTEAASIAGTVKDATGAVLPGVTVEASSPALIEKVRTVVTDGAGQYKIVELRPGTYAVTFSLPGFNSVKREGIELTTGFTANVNTDLKVGSVTETITVSGQSPIVDIQNTKQRMVMTRDVVDTIPTGKTFNSMGALIPGIVLTQNAGTSMTQDVGGQSGNDHMVMAIHGGRGPDQQIQLDGLSIATMLRVDSAQQYIVDGPFQEFAYDFAANSAEVQTGGVRVNLIPREGANTFSGRLFADFSNSKMQSTNTSTELQQRGLADPNREKTLWNISPTLGGPILKDQLWFFGSFTRVRIDKYAGGMYTNADVTAWKYQPVLSQQAVDDQWVRDSSVRLTWQVTPRNKIGLFYENNASCQCHFGVGSSTAGTLRITPEATPLVKYYTPVYQLTWASPVTNRFLFEAGGLWSPMRSPWDAQPEAVLPSITDVGSGLAFRSYSSGVRFFQSPIWSTRGSVSYVTGSHAVKVGVTSYAGIYKVKNSLLDNVTYTTFNGRPTAVTYFGDPYALDVRIAPNLGVYGQDQWTLKRLTANAGLRFDYFRTGYADEIVPPTQYVLAERSFPGQVVVSWKDLSPRAGVSYDLLGNGKTALKGSLNRYVLQQGNSLASAVNPVTNNNSVTRQWTDNNGDFVVQGDPFNQAANGELGPSTNLNFGKPTTVTSYDPSWAKGFGLRPYNWEMSAGIQHELMPRVSVSAAYFRRLYGNFFVTANQAVTASDYNPYCVTVPVDPRLGTSGQQLCGLFDLNPNQVGKINNIVTGASKYGKQYEHWNGIDVTMNARLAKALLQGGLSSGKTMTDNCDITTESPQVIATAAPPGGLSDPALTSGPSTSMQFCHVETPFLTQVKLLGSYTLPWEVQIAATFQSIPGRQLAANAVFTSAQIAPSLGRSLAAASTVTIEVLPPATLYEERLNQLDLRFSKSVMIGRTRFQGTVDLYNALNNNVVLVENTTYGSNGSQWRNPLTILPARAIRVGGHIDF